MVSNEDREAKAGQWLQRIAGGGGFEDVAGRLLPAAWVEAWRSVPVEEEPAWRRTMAGAPSDTSRSTVVARTAPPGFARVCIAGEPSTMSAPLHLQLHLANGRRAELVLSDERQLPRVLELLEQSP